MSDQLKFVDTQWRWTYRFFFVWPLWCAPIIGINIWQHVSKGLPFNWYNFLLGVGIALFGGIVYFFSRLIFSLVRGVVSDRDGRS